MGKIYAAKTNHITNPLGFYLKPLVFSWKVKGCRGQEQKYARIVISKNKTFTDICYDTATLSKPMPRCGVTRTSISAVTFSMPALSQSISVW